ncbi:MAG: DUF2975 domain-containing protein [Bacteroidia bacterium]|nr:DUF2975 domain-containing protein [Bacteroidia bacterium]
MQKNQLIKYCNLIVIATAIYGLTIFYNLFTIGYDIGKQMAINDKAGVPVSNDIFLWGMISQAIITFGIFAVCLLFFFFVSNVQKGLIFVSENAKLLMVYGCIVSGLGILSFISNKFSGVTNSLFASGLLILTGLCFVFISLIFKIGIKMQEEQDLTI